MHYTIILCMYHQYAHVVPYTVQLYYVFMYYQSYTCTVQKDLMWRLRFYLSCQKKALTKYLKSVSWNVPQKAKQALDLLAKWEPHGC